MFEDFASGIPSLQSLMGQLPQLPQRRGGMFGAPGQMDPRLFAMMMQQQQPQQQQQGPWSMLGALLPIGLKAAKVF